jgi:CRISPR-associated protein Csb1
MLDLSPLDGVSRLLLAVPLKPVQGDRFQPTGFPSLGAATYQTKDGPKLLVESAQSMANRLEATCWDSSTNKPVAALDGISHVTVTRGKDKDDKPRFLTDSMLEAHRLNSVYIERSNGDFFRNILPKEIGASKEEPVNRKKFIEALLKFDVGCLIHGVFLESLDGRLRVARALSAFVEASGIQVAASGGVKNDRVKATTEEGKTSKEGFGNVPFARDEYVADRIDCHINLDLAQIRGYGLDLKVQKLLILLSLYRVCKLLEGDLRLRTACDLEPIDRDNVIAARPVGFKLPSLGELESAVKAAITECKDLMVNTTVTYEDELKKAKDDKKPKADDADDSDDDEDNDTENDDN